MKLLMHCGMSGHAAGVGINLFLGSLMPLVCYGIIRQITVLREIALAGALLTASHPMAIELSINIQRGYAVVVLCGRSRFLRIARFEIRPMVLVALLQFQFDRIGLTNSHFAPIH